MKKTNLTWEEVSERAAKLAHIILHLPNITSILSKKGPQPIKIFGVPRGGIPAALLVAQELAQYHINSIMVDLYGQCHIAIDDIIDSGKTRDSYIDEYEDEEEFFALVDKQTEQDKDIGWVVFPWERMANESEGPEENVRRLLEYIGEDPDREGLKDTPARVIKSYKTLFGGYEQKPEDIITIFKDHDCDEIVLLKGIEFYSTCEHHMLPFYGKAHIAYIPNDKLVGISKLARILEIFSRRLQIQERLCKQVTGAIEELLEPLGAACVLEAQHLCMTCRGVQKQNSVMTTSSLTGVFRTDARARSEFMSMIK
jgi:GTP cyclohydrolase IA